MRDRENVPYSIRYDNDAVKWKGNNSLFSLLQHEVVVLDTNIMIGPFNVQLLILSHHLENIM